MSFRRAEIYKGIYKSIYTAYTFICMQNCCRTGIIPDCASVCIPACITIIIIAPLTIIIFLCIQLPPPRIQSEATPQQPQRSYSSLLFCLFFSIFFASVLIFPSVPGQQYHQSMNSELTENCGCTYTAFILLKAGKSIGAQKRKQPETPTNCLKPHSPHSCRTFHFLNVYGYFQKWWRRKRDSNPRPLAGSPVFKTGALNHSAIPPSSQCIKYISRPAALSRSLSRPLYGSAPPRKSATAA